jgi:hypothetical protein
MVNFLRSDNWLFDESIGGSPFCKALTAGKPVTDREMLLGIKFEAEERGRDELILWRLQSRSLLLC